MVNDCFPTLPCICHWTSFSRGSTWIKPIIKGSTGLQTIRTYRAFQYVGRNSYRPSRASAYASALMALCSHACLSRLSSATGRYRTFALGAISLIRLRRCLNTGKSLPCPAGLPPSSHRRQRFSHACTLLDLVGFSSDGESCRPTALAS